MTLTRRDSGFTLLEMIVALAIVALMFDLVLQRGPLRSPRLAMEAATRDAVGALRLARSRAIAESRPVALAFAGNAYRMQGSAPLPLPSGVTLASAVEIRFAPDGSASGGMLVLRDTATQVRISVDWLTGRIHVEQRH